MEKRRSSSAGRGSLVHRMVWLAGGVLLGVLLLGWSCSAGMLSGDFGRPTSLRILYAANACGIFQPCPT